MNILGLLDDEINNSDFYKLITQAQNMRVEDEFGIKELKAYIDDE